MTLEQFLNEQAAKDEAITRRSEAFCRHIVAYREDIVPEAIRGDEWLEKSVSYIWKVGVLSIADGNKRDWAYLFIGHEREPGNFDYIGRLQWLDGENDDIARCLPRYLKAAAQADILYDPD